jgi:Uma2 family endonuclease
MREVSRRYVYYYEGEYLDEDEMPENFIQHELSNYLEEILRWHFRSEKYLVSGNINIYRKGRYKERVAPDVMVVKELGVAVESLRREGSYEIDPPKRPAPAVAIEIISEGTASYDIKTENKPSRYGEMGVREYFAFDPEDALGTVKLRGWRYIEGLRTEVSSDKRGWMWSNELECWLVPDDMVLQFYDKTDKRLPTGREAEAERAEQERLGKLEAEQKAEQERLGKLEAEQKAEQERLAKEAERQAREEAERKAEELERLVAELRAKLGEQQG